MRNKVLPWHFPSAVVERGSELGVEEIKREDVDDVVLVPERQRERGGEVT